MADRTMLMQKVASNAPLTAEEQAHVSMALETQDKVGIVNEVVDQFVETRRKTGKFDWTILTNLLPILLNLIPGVGPILAIVPGILDAINKFIALFGGKPIPVPPLPTPTPTPSGVIPPTPVASSPN